MALEMIFMIWLPWFTAHVAKTFPAQTCHIITPSWPLNNFRAPRTYFSIDSNPFSICFFFHDQVYPFIFLFTANWRMIIFFAFKTKEFSAIAWNAHCIEIIALNTVNTINSRATLIASIDCCKLFADKFFITRVEFIALIAHCKNSHQNFIENWNRTT